MNKEISPKIMVRIPHHIVSVVFGVLVTVFLIGFWVFAWTEPATSPPKGNTTAPLNISNISAPLNAGIIGQSKEGGLMLNTGGAAIGLIVDKGDVGIGTTAPSYKLDVVGKANADELCIKKECIPDWSGITMPSGMVALFSKSCPTGWTKIDLTVPPSQSVPNVPSTVSGQYVAVGGGTAADWEWVWCKKN